MVQAAVTEYHSLGGPEIAGLFLTLLEAEVRDLGTGGFGVWWVLIPDLLAVSSSGEWGEAPPHDLVIPQRPRLLVPAQGVGVGRSIIQEFRGHWSMV